ncbi:NADH:flavin oxidoreductase/NADH oxidase [Kitasatospora sp. NPDC051853]|uniref:NADH:flavin oxidoreductase/NADH oxidase n=1 Tax=Kitasatospora sp. NPDC051853 TaxID=3364058 RepID=UPI003796C838
MSALFEPLVLRELTIPNRVWMAAMCMYSAAPDGPEVGAATDFHLAHYAARAAGGAGLVITEATAVRPEGRISPWDLGLWTDRQQEQAARVAALITSLGAVPAVQLAHAGRKAGTDRPWLGGKPLPAGSVGGRPVGPSAVGFSDEHVQPHELTVEEIREVVEAFAASARRALAAGFKTVEVHGAHGYLIHSFLSPHSNHRTDGYGGDFAGRARLALEVTDAVRAVWPAELPVLFRVSATDWLEPEVPGWTSEETVRLAKELQARGVDLIDVSTGGNVADARIPAAPGFQVPFATEIRNGTGLPTGAVGLITEPAQAERILTEGAADVVLLGRALLADPYWPQRAARELGAETRYPVQHAYTMRRR